MATKIPDKGTIDFTQFYDLIAQVFWNLFENKSKIQIIYGGSGSGKSYSAFLIMIYNVVVNTKINYLVCRKVSATNTHSTYALTQQLISELGLTEIFKENKSEKSFTCLLNKNKIIFKGLDNVEKMKSVTFPSGLLTNILVEEASEIQQKDFNQLLVRLRGKSKHPFQISLLLNPINERHWIKVNFFDLQSYQKTNKVFIVHSTYKDNPFLEDDYRQTLEGYKDIDFQFYKVYCLGEWGQFSEIIFNNWTFSKCPYKEEDFDSVHYGADFGFQHPNVIVKVGLKNDCLYSFEEIAVTKKTNKEFIDIVDELGFYKAKGKLCIGDSASPDTVKEWHQLGYNMHGAEKGTGSVRRGIDFIKSKKWFIDDVACPRLAYEVQIFHNKKIKRDGVEFISDEPIELFDDAIKATMYALEPLSKFQNNSPGVIINKKSVSRVDEIKGEIETRKDIRRLEIEQLKELKRKRFEKMKAEREARRK